MADDIKKVVAKVAQQSAAVEKKPEELMQLVVFELDKEEYAVPIIDLREIIKIPEITPIPNAPEFIRGILNLRGKIVVVVDLEKRFHLVRENKIASQHIVITEVGENIFGIIVDEVAEVLRVPVTSIQPAPALVSSKIHHEYLKGVVVLDAKEPTRELSEEECRELLAAHQTKKPSGKSPKDKPTGQARTRLLILLDLSKMLQEKELLELGSQVSDVTSDKR
ncbi:chemotaxis protein CheW [Patescibacteria group bacterium AH-259-L07]|nr:chemotaxis protein CheW [Patescibacteria group bacterium AH-259-L07]